MVIFYPEENMVRLLFSSEEATLKDEYSIKTSGLYSTDGNIATITDNTGYLANIEDSLAYEFFVTSLSVCDALGKSVGFAKESGNYTVKIVYTNPENTEKTVTVKNGENDLCTFSVEANSNKTLTKTVYVVEGEIFNLSWQID